MDPKKQNKGKSASTSITNIAIRFHADDEELEQVVQPSIETSLTETASKREPVEDEIPSVSSSMQLLTPTSSHSELSGSSIPLSASSTVLGRLGKRSASLESAAPTEPSSGDAWRLFREVRGRITKTVEEKIEEIKSDRLKSNKGKQKHKLGTKVEHSSISDSEDQSESSPSLRPSDNFILSSTLEKKDCDLTIIKKNDNQSDSGRSTPVIGGGSSSEKDDFTNSNNQKDKSIIDDDCKKKDKFDQQSDKISKKKEKQNISFGVEEKIATDEKKKDKLEDESYKSKEKKSRRFHFRERFHGSPDKKKEEMSMKFSSLKDGDDSEEDEHVTVEYGLEASETVNIVEAASLQKVQVKPTVSSPVEHYFSKVKQFIWNWKHVIIIVGFSIAHYMWLANYVLGFMFGVYLTLQITFALDWFRESFVVREPSSHDYTEQNSESSSLVYPIFSSSQYFSPQDNPEKIVHEGWMNEFSQEYSPDSYHISLSETVHIKVEGSLLTLSNPSTKIPKRAYWNEPDHKKLFNRQRLFDIAGCKVQLLPVGLTHKRIWSKKYPICITLLKMSKLGVRYRSKGKITIEDDQEWLDPEVDDTTPIEIPDDQEIFPMDPIEQVVPEEEKIKDKCAEGDKPEGKGELVLCSEDPLTKDKPKSGQSDSGNEDEDEEDFVRISPSILNEFCIYLFARCDRQKEIWFRRLVTASGLQQNVPIPPVEKEINNDSSESGTTSIDDTEKQQKSLENPEEKPEISAPENPQYNKEKQYLNFMNKLGQKKVPKLPSKDKETNTKQLSSSKQSSSSPTTTSSSTPPVTSDDMYTVCEEIMWVNAFGGRLLYDVLKDAFWLNKINEKFQRKLSAIKLPYFMEELVISHIDFGETVPLIQRASRPILNENGIWVDLDMVYEGHFQVTIDTKLNLMKLKKAQGSLDDSDTNLLCSSNTNVSLLSASSSDVFQVSSSPSYTMQKSAIFDSDVEDSAESSSEELDVGKTGPITLPDVTPSSPGSTTSHKMLRMVDKIAASKYFQQVTEYKYIKRAMEGVSNTNIALVVEVRRLAGTLVLNFPPPPSDRLWYGFRPDPQLQLSAQPKVGDRTISLLHISTWIERRLRREFQKLLVLPNMDDLIIPVMNKEHPS
ncbi:testis-expressed protein 2-like isoform X2 [Lycorma delicatula]|uniref:testis-expressed protein 2-like isoform X2 n=1 Tax=Lycorma delicatula TaxID=130591 RepID=UPI003F51869A